MENLKDIVINGGSVIMRLLFIKHHSFCPSLFDPSFCPLTVTSVAEHRGGGGGGGVADMDSCALQSLNEHGLISRVAHLCLKTAAEQFAVFDPSVKQDPPPPPTLQSGWTSAEGSITTQFYHFLAALLVVDNDLSKQAAVHYGSLTLFIHSFDAN